MKRSTGLVALALVILLLATPQYGGAPGPPESLLAYIRVDPAPREHHGNPFVVSVGFTHVIGLGQGSSRPCRTTEPATRAWCAPIGIGGWSVVPRRFVLSESRLTARFDGRRRSASDERASRAWTFAPFAGGAYRGRLKAMATRTLEVRATEAVESRWEISDRFRDVQQITWEFVLTSAPGDHTQHHFRCHIDYHVRRNSYHVVQMDGAGRKLREYDVVRGGVHGAMRHWETTDGNRTEKTTHYWYGTYVPDAEFAKRLAKQKAAERSNHKTPARP